MSTSEVQPKKGERGPYLKVSGPNGTSGELDLTASQITIGRADESDITFLDETIASHHALIKYVKGQYVLQHLGTGYFTLVNRKCVDSHVLQHGDIIEISPYTLQFRAKPRRSMGLDDAMFVDVRAKAEQLLHINFRLLPSGKRVKYRILSVAPETVFKSGDTLRVKGGGVLLPVRDAPDESTLELILTDSDELETCFIGEILGVIRDADIDWMCLKLHQLSKQQHDVATATGSPGPWIEVSSTDLVAY